MAQLPDKKLFLLDLDGTLYLDDTLFPGTLPFLQRVRERGGRVIYLTNNSSRSPQDYARRLTRLGVEAGAGDFLTSTDALIALLRRRPPYRLCYVLGTDSFREQLRQAGIPVTCRPEEGVDCLLAGFDTELTFQKLEDACLLLSRGVDFYATHPDWVCPTRYGAVPDCGSVCEMLTRATGRKPQEVVGKPRPDMVRLAMERAGCTPEQTLLVGDRLYTDIACGVNAGVDTAFVLSGEGTLDQLGSSKVLPTWVVDDVGVLAGCLDTGEVPLPAQAQRERERRTSHTLRVLGYFALIMLSLAGLIGCSVAAVWLLSSVFHMAFEDVLMTGIRAGFLAWLALFLVLAILHIRKRQRQ